MYAERMSAIEWQKHFFKRWPRMKLIYEEIQLRFECRYGQKTEFLVLSKLSLKYRKELNNFLTMLSEHYKECRNLNNCEGIKRSLKFFFYRHKFELPREHPINPFFVLDKYATNFKRRKRVDARECEKWIHLKCPFAKAVSVDLFPPCLCCAALPWAMVHRSEPTNAIIAPNIARRPLDTWWRDEETHRDAEHRLVTDKLRALIADLMPNSEGQTYSGFHWKN